MNKIIVVNNPKKWKIDVNGINIISARDYVIDPIYTKNQAIKVFNLCTSYKYQSMGYYVSLLAGARGQRAFPSIHTMQEMKSHEVVKIITEDFDSLIQKSLEPLHSEQFTLSVYFGKNLAKKYDKLCIHLSNIFHAPLFRVFFTKRENKWKIQSVQLISANDIPDEHLPFVMEFAQDFFFKKKFYARNIKSYPFDMAILVNPDEKLPPSNKVALNKFERAAESCGFCVEFITKNDYHRLAEFDALFIRDTTSVNHYTFKFAQRAEAEGLVVMDDPISIIKCTNKVYLAEMLNFNNIASPKSIIVSQDIISEIINDIEYPVILKQPDSSYSQGVVKVNDQKELLDAASSLFKKSDLIILQEFMPSDFDWRIGIIAGKVIYACKYFMARNHWKIVNWETSGKNQMGKSETVAIEDVPEDVIDLALKSTSLIGNGIYGVDIKTYKNKNYIIEVNDNPSIDNKVEDQLLKDDLYLKIMRVFEKRVRMKKEG